MIARVDRDREEGRDKGRAWCERRGNDMHVCVCVYIYVCAYVRVSVFAY